MKSQKGGPPEKKKINGERPIDPGYQPVGEFSKWRRNAGLGERKKGPPLEVSNVLRKRVREKKRRVLRAERSVAMNITRGPRRSSKVFLSKGLRKRSGPNAR